MADQDLKAQVSAVLHHHGSDEIILDAFGQVAMDPTSGTAYSRGYTTIGRLWRDIGGNLALRYGLSPSVAEAVVKEVATSIERFLPSRGERTQAIYEWLAGSGGDILRRGIKVRLEAGDQRASHCRAEQTLAFQGGHPPCY